MPITCEDTTRHHGPSHRDRQHDPAPVTGVLEVGHRGGGFLRTTLDCPGRSGDVQVPASLIRRLNLRKGDHVAGMTGRGRQPQTLTVVESVNGQAPEGLHDRPHFADLTPVHPGQRLRLETSANVATTRIIDLFAPVGKGQRGLIVAPPKAGKTVLLQRIADAIATNHPECHLMVVLLDERPEEVTDMRRSVRGEVAASTFDRPVKQHIALAELAIERAKRLVELGHDVVVLLDSLTRLCRAHNYAASAGGRILSGGVDAAALHGPKRFFGAARLVEEGGSLTILATTLVETGSRADDLFFEELKSTGNMELRLERSLADRRIFPAVDVTTSGTRRDELLLGPPELHAVRNLRRALQAQRDPKAALEVLLERLRETSDNTAFLHQVHGAAPASDE
jgi:transcription termination factor Rho